MFNRNFFPANVNDGQTKPIETQEQEKRPIAFIQRKRLFNFNFTPNSLPSNSKDKKETDARNFPLIRGL